MESLQKQMGTPVGNPQALDKLKKDLEKLQEAAKGMADKNSPASAAERQKLSEALSALSKQMQDMGLQLPQLDDAIKAMAANQPDLVLKDLQAAADGPREDARHGQVSSSSSSSKSRSWAKTWPSSSRTASPKRRRRRCRR